MPSALIKDGTFRRLGCRSLNEETCKKFNYRLAVHKNRHVQVADYFDHQGNLVAQKLRFPDKSFTWLGEPKNAALFGAQLWGKGRMIVVTEGEIDAMTLSQVQGNKWPVVSVPNGAQGAKRSISKNLEYLSNFETVVLMLDSDAQGQKAAMECAEALGPSRCKVATLPLKDPNEMLLAGMTEELINAMWNAKPYQPEGVLAGSELLEVVMAEDDIADTVLYPWEKLNEKTYGLRRPEITTFTAGTGVGKSAIVRELAYHLGNQVGHKVGLIMLEESSKRTALGMMGIHMQKPLHISREGIEQADLVKAFEETMGTGNYFLIDHFGSTEMETLMQRIRYLVTGCECAWVVLDHLSIVVSGSVEGDERRSIDSAMTQLRTLVQELGFGLLLVHHLRRPDGKGHENGAEVFLSQLRGSHAVAQLSDMVIGVERDQQGEDPNLSTIRVLKNRFSGETGISGYLRYEKETGRLWDVEPSFEPTEPSSDTNPDF